MTKEGEPTLQLSLFTGESVDNRTPKQKRLAREQDKPQQAMMFSQRDMAQFGVEAHPKLPLSSKTRLELMVEDRRTEEEIAADIQSEALRNNLRMFEEENPAQAEQEDSN